MSENIQSSSTIVMETELAIIILLLSALILKDNIDNEENQENKDKNKNNNKENKDNRNNKIW